MSSPLAWRHLILHTRNTWLHGDPRGFRDRHHRLHSSGDYKHPPPPDEHLGLRHWAKQRSGDPVILERDLRPLIATAFAARLQKEGFDVLCISCSSTHLHALPLVPLDRPTLNQLVGRCKRNASGAAHAKLSGPLWAQGGSFKLIKDRTHQLSTYHYITERQERGSFVWTFRGQGYWME